MCTYSSKYVLALSIEGDRRKMRYHRFRVYQSKVPFLCQAHTYKARCASTKVAFLAQAHTGLDLHTNGDFFVFLVLGEWRGGGLTDCKKQTSFALVVLDDGLC